MITFFCQKYHLFFSIIIFFGSFESIRVENNVTYTGEIVAQQSSPISSSYTNETGSWTDIWNSLITVNKSSLCPGECVHAITSLFCDQVLEEIYCGGSMFRCCISSSQHILNEFHTEHDSDPHIDQNDFYTVRNVTESTPLLSSEAPMTTMESFSVISNNHHLDLANKKNDQFESSMSDPIGHQWIESSTFLSKNDSTKESHNVQSTINDFKDFVNKTDKVSRSCPLECRKLSTKCLRPLKNVSCPVDYECCLDSDKENSNTDQSLDTLTKNFIKLVQETVALNQTKNIGTEFSNNNINSQRNSHHPILPPCNGTCVVPLFHMLCDEIDHQQFCKNGYCCVNREPAIVASSSTVPTIPSCDGYCLPVILSGMCNKPFELLLKTIDCRVGTICCRLKKSTDSEEDVDDHLSSSTIQINPMASFPRPILNSVSIPVPPRIPIQQTKPISFSVINNPPPQSPSAPPLLIDGNNFHFLSPEENQNHPVVTDAGSNLGPMNPVDFIPKELFGCPGKCINSMFKFTCLGSYSINKNFKCSKGQICCVSSQEIEKFLLFLHHHHYHHQEIPSVHQIEHQQQLLPVHSHQHQQSHSMINPDTASSLKTPAVYPNTVTKPPLVHKFHPISSQPLSQSSSISSYVLYENDSDSRVNFPDEKKTSSTSTLISSHKRSNVCGVKGLRRSARVVGGADSYPGEWCWQIALVNQKNKYICGGALIGKQWALTAAHCVSSYLRKSDAVFVRTGEYDLAKNDRLGRTHKVAAVYVHHNHNSQTMDNDIALLKLQSPAELNENTCLICLPTSRNQDYRKNFDKHCIVTGYGSKQEFGPITLRIREASIPIIDDQECVSKINAVTEKTFLLPASSFCAGGEGDNDACQGDGGSGLVCETDGFYELTGLVSWGFGCGRLNVPGVYAKVSTFIGWINQIVSTNF
ncbi:Transmembrane protease serine 2 [Sarcoptes scabiei]|uniref:Transmembrane protease serine 2 n=1 Tax=Sarcoptes scabiei TaxID=52283 RepID=A0A834VJ70_SARSC|nr:Transmembrane protease serine 2 [Sarcoptes scabiei]